MSLENIDFSVTNSHMTVKLDEKIANSLYMTVLTYPEDETMKVAMVTDGVFITLPATESLVDELRRLIRRIEEASRP